MAVPAGADQNADDDGTDGSLGESPATPRVAAKLRRSARPPWQTALVVTAYLLGFILLDLFARQFEERGGIVAWYPPAGLTYALLLVCGVRFTPAVAIALFMSSVFVYRMPQPPYLLFVWSVIVSCIYGMASMFLRLRIRLDWRLQKLRDVAWFVSVTVLVSALLAVLSVSSSAASGNLPRDELLSATFHWWIGEAVGILTVTPFLLIHVAPVLGRFTRGQTARSPQRVPWPHPTPAFLGQVASLAVVLYWVFGARVPSEYHPLYLVALPLIWIALKDGIKGVSAALLVLNLGVVLALWLIHFDVARLGELELLMIVNCIVSLLMGAVVGEQAQTQGALRGSEARFREVLENSVDASYKRNLQTGAYEYLSPVFARISGYTPDEFANLALGTDLEWVHPDDRAQVEGVMTASMSAADGAPHRVDYRFKHKDDEYRWFRDQFIAVRDAEGRPVAQIGSVSDITEQADAEQRRVRAEAEREGLQAQLVQAQKMESVGRLAGGVAHDFNNMLGVILGHAELALQDVDPALPLYDDLLQIRKAGQRSADLTRQLLAFARRQTIAPRALDLNDTVEGMLRMLRRLIGEDIDLIWRPQARLWPIKMDPSQVDQILANLCVNARDAIAGVGQVTIETSNLTLDDVAMRSIDGGAHAAAVPGDYVQITVSDDGCGMDKETLERIFEPFFTTKEVGQGTGLGLATVYGIVKQNDGHISVRSERGDPRANAATFERGNVATSAHGTTFRIYLPRHAVAEVEARPAGVTQTPRGRGETVLLVEDEEGILRMVKRVLESLGYRVLAAGAPAEALLRAEEHAGEIDLLITDVVMPGMSGRELAQRLLVRRPTLKCLYMSGYTANVIAHRGVLDEGVTFIQKPFSPQALAARVREVLDRNPASV